MIYGQTLTELPCVTLANKIVFTAISKVEHAIILE